MRPAGLKVLRAGCVLVFWLIMRGVDAEASEKRAPTLQEELAEYGVKYDGSSLMNAALSNSLAIVREKAVRALRSDSRGNLAFYMLLATNDPSPGVQIEAARAIGTNDLVFSRTRLKNAIGNSQSPWRDLAAIEYLAELGDYSEWSTLDKYLATKGPQTLLRSAAIQIAPLFAATNRQEVLERLTTLLDASLSRVSAPDAKDPDVKRAVWEIRRICRAISVIGEPSVLSRLDTMVKSASGEVKSLLQETMRTLEQKKVGIARPVAEEGSCE